MFSLKIRSVTIKSIKNRRIVNKVLKNKGYYKINFLKIINKFLDRKARRTLP
jgi:hypothetical protein